MDPEALKSLGTLLLWGVLFFVMMRFGCGAHMAGGHGHHGGNVMPDEQKESKDPVCGMAVEPAKAAGASVHAGRTHYFCSTSCRDKFEKEPEKYADPSVSGESRPGAHQC